MAISMDYFDSIQIDVVKRKYYNANKVNAVFEDIRVQVLELLEENERLKKQLSSRKSETEDMLSLPQIYRETLQKAHDRADGIEKEARENGERLAREAEEQRRAADSLLADCVQNLRKREEENIAYLERQLERFRNGKPGEESETGSTDAFQRDTEEEAAERLPDLEELERRISLLAKEIQAMEQET